jgi:hypothetical protein
MRSALPGFRFPPDMNALADGRYCEGSQGTMSARTRPRWEGLVCGHQWWSTHRMTQESVAEIVGRLRFVSSPAPAIYLNEQLVKEMFVAQLGAIDSFTRTAARELTGEGGVGGFLKVGGSKSGTQQVDYDLREPLTQALVLHSALGNEGKVQPARAGLLVGTYVDAIGEAYLPDLGIPQPPLAGFDDQVAALEAERDRQQQVVRAFGDMDTALTLLLLKSDSTLAASVIDMRHVRPGNAASYLGAQQAAFGIMERSVVDVPLFTLLYMRAYI